MGDEGRIVLSARAKINLGLEVLGKRPDGYHEIRTLIQSIGLADRVEIATDPTGRLTLRCPDSDLPTDETNLALRAARLLRDRAGATAGARIRLSKRIPVGAGLGGGSSDAAAVLAGLNRIWRLRLPPGRLEEIAAEIGSDVPFFIRGGTQLAEGRGERLTRLASFPSVPILVVTPNLAVPTASVYSSLKMPLTPLGPFSRLPLCESTTHSDVVGCAIRLRNDLEATVLRRFPQIRALMQRMTDPRVPVVRVTGSGSSFYLLGGDRDVLRGVGRAAPKDACRVFRTCFRSRGWVSVRTTRGWD